jgi:ketosteroid isomerase-like protein
MSQSPVVELLDDHGAAMLDIADRLFDAILAGDIDALRGIYAPDAVIWHNTDGVEERLEQHLRVAGWMSKIIPDLRFEEVRRIATPAGFVAQHVVRGRAPSGREAHIPWCAVGTVVNGRITRLDEYLDWRHISMLMR